METHRGKEGTAQKSLNEYQCTISNNYYVYYTYNLGRRGRYWSIRYYPPSEISPKNWTYILQMPTDHSKNRGNVQKVEQIQHTNMPSISIFKNNNKVVNKKTIISLQSGNNQRLGLPVLVDQLVAPTPVIIAQMIGRLTTKRYKYATIFVDPVLRLGYV